MVEFFSLFSCEVFSGIDNRAVALGFKDGGEQGNGQVDKLMIPIFYFFAPGSGCLLCNKPFIHPRAKRAQSFIYSLYYQASKPFFISLK